MLRSFRSALSTGRASIVAGNSIRFTPQIALGVRAAARWEQIFKGTSAQSVRR